MINEMTNTTCVGALRFIFRPPWLRLDRIKACGSWADRVPPPMTFRAAPKTASTYTMQPISRTTEDVIAIQ
jgi:hypothetical protein